MPKKFLAVLLLGLGLMLCSPSLQAIPEGGDSTRRIGILPVPAIGFSPETKLYFGTVSLFTLRLYDDSLQRISNAKAEITYSLNKQLILQMAGTLIFREERYILQADNSFQKFPELVWGLGQNTRSDSSELYEGNRLEFDNVMLKKVRGAWFAGLGMRVQNVSKLEYIDGGLFDRNLLPGREGGWSNGLGYMLRYDSRENLFNPAPGNHYLSFRHDWFSESWGSAYVFQRLTLDARTYLSLFKRGTLAFQLFAQATPGDAPFRMMPLLGSASHMRGYYRGRYRDEYYGSAQAEYRFKVWRWAGLAIFGGAGDISPTIDQFGLNGLKPTVGGGLRILVDKAENINLRLDFAYGKESSGFYVSFGEAF